MKSCYSLKFIIRRSFFTILVFFISIQSYAQIDLQKGLIACYPFSGSADDATGNGNNGTLMNGPQLVEDRFGKPANAYKFDGIDDYIDISPNNLKNNNYTYSLWANVSSLPTQGNNYAVWSIGNTNFTGAGDQFIMLGSNYIFTTQNGWYGGGYNVEGGTALKAVGSLPTANTWYHLAVTRDDNQVLFYVDGNLIGSFTTNGGAPRYGGSGGVVEARIGNRSPYLSGQNFKGIIDDFSIYNRALSSEEIKVLYNNFSCSPIPPPSAQNVSRCGPGTLILSATGGIQYRWYDAVIGGNPLGTGANFTTSILTASKKYYVAAYNGTSESSRIEVTAVILPVPDSPIVEDVSRCGSGEVTLKASGGSNYRWYNDINSTNPLSTEAVFITPFLPSSSVYYVSSINGNCESAKKAVHITINPLPQTPIINLDGPTSICQGEKVTLLGPPGYSSYKWSNGAETQNIEVSESGSFTVRVKNTYGCESAPSTPILINVVSNITPSVSIEVKKNPVCSDSLITFIAKSVNGGQNPLYLWKVNGAKQGNPSTSPVFVYSFTGSNQPIQAEVSVEMSSTYSCADPKQVIAQKNIIIQPNLTPQLSISSIKDTFCTGSEIILLAHITNSEQSTFYQWQINGINRGLPTTSAEFKLDTSNFSANSIQIEIGVVLLSNNSCSNPVKASKWITITPNPDILCMFPDIIEARSKNIFQIKVNNGQLPYSFIWNFGNGEIFSSQTDTISYTFTNPNDYLVTVTINDRLGCETICNKLIKVKPIINIPPNVFTPNGDSFNERFTIDYEGQENFEMIIYNRWGKPLTSIYDGKKGWDGLGCSTGIYFYIIRVEDKVFKGWVHLLR